GGETAPERYGRHQGVHDDRNDHHGHQEARAATGMIRRILLDWGYLERVSGFEGEHSFVLGAVVLIHAGDVFQQRGSPDEQQEQGNANRAVYQVKYNALAENRIDPLKFRRGQQWKKLVHENEKSDGDQDIDGSDPAAEFQLLAGFRLRLNLVESYIGGETQGTEAERHRVAKRHDTANHRPAHPFMLFRQALQRLAVDGNLATRSAHGNAPGMRGSHHDAFENGLAADKSFLTALQSRQELNGHEKTPYGTQKLHVL